MTTLALAGMAALLAFAYSALAVGSHADRATALILRKWDMEKQMHKKLNLRDGQYCHLNNGRGIIGGL